MRAALSCVLLPAAALAQSAACDVMANLSETFRACESAVDRSGDGAAAGVVAGAARSLRAHLPALAAIAPQQDVEHRQETALHVAALQRAVTALEGAADADVGLRHEALRDIRGACTACHLQFRDDNARRGLFPLAGAAVYGRVRVQRSDGTPAAAERAVVFLEGALPVAGARRQREVIVQKDRRFVPPVVAVTAGSTVAFPNRDAVFHNVFSLSKPKPFDLGLYGGGQTKEVVFDQPGLVKVFCNIHPEMVAHVLVLPTDLSCVTTPSGFYCIVGAPGGIVTARVWSELGEETRATLVLADLQATAHDVTVTEVRQRIVHRDKNGRPYREKY